MRVADRLRAAFRAFKLGPGLDQGQLAFGVDGSEYSPAEYGEYIATSNAVYVCANKRAKMLRKLPLRLYKLNKKGEKEPVTSGLCYERLQKANPWWTFRRLIQFTEMSLCLWGKSFWFLERGASGRGPVREIWWARPDRVTIVPHETPCLRCIFLESPPPGTTPTCDTAGILSSIASIVANMECTEAIKLLVGATDKINRGMIWIDVW